MTFRMKMGAAALALTMSAGAPAAFAQAEFYKDKTVNIYVGYSSGGGYDVYARMLSRFYGRHIPGNPTVIVTNMPGAGSLRAANYIYNLAPKDGTAIGTVARGAAFDPLFGLPGTQFDAVKYNWIGSANDEVSVCVAWHTSVVKTFDDLLAKELIVGGTGGSADTDQFPRVLNGVLDTKMKVIVGYPGGDDINIAWSAAKCRAVAAGPGRASSPHSKNGLMTRRSASSSSSPWKSTKTCRMSPR
jgi:hypothetical protein